MVQILIAYLASQVQQFLARSMKHFYFYLMAKKFHAQLALPALQVFIVQATFLRRWVCLKMP
jgi:hypothetical protein